MNKKGQVLILFVIMIPVIITFFLILMDNIYLSYQKKKIYSVTKLVISKNFSSDNKNDIIKMFNDNNIDVEKLIIDNNDGKKLSFTTKIKGFLKEYQINISIKGVLKDDKIVYQKD